MASTARKLQLVEEEPPADADESLTQEAMEGWTPGQRRCRGRHRHNWGPYTVWEHRTYYDVVEQCSHCKNRRSADYVKTARGLRQATKWKPLYKKGYLLPKGAARIQGGLQDELVAADILSRKIVEVVDDEDENDR